MTTEAATLAVPATVTWTPPHGAQTAALRAAGLKTKDLRDAGFTWSRAQAWEAPFSHHAQEIVDALTKGEPLPPAGESMEISGEETADRQALPERILPTKITRQGVPTHRVQAIKDRLHKRIEAKEHARQSNTPKRMKQYMQAINEAGHMRRAVEIADRWMSAPTLPVPSEAQLMDAASQEQTQVQNGYHSYGVDSGTPRKTACPVALSLRALMEGKPAAPAVPNVAVMEAQVRFQDIPGFFPTPEALAVRMVELADLCAGDRVLEPSAGKGDLALQVKMHGAEVECFEVVPRLCEILRAKGLDAECCDFLDFYPSEIYDAVVMNPPFEKGQDIDHVRHAFKFLRPGGRLVAIISGGALQRMDRKASEFQAWLDEVGAEATDNGQAFAGVEAFRQTGVRTSTVVIRKGEG